MIKIKPTVYLDTSAINFLFADDAPEKRDITIDFFDNFVKTGIYQSFISNFVLQEINQTDDDEKREKLLEALNKYYVENIQLHNLKEIEQLAQLYIQRKVISPNKLFDALHIAVAVTHKIDYLVSWNYKHLANINRERRVVLINTEFNYLHPLRIITPIELINYEI